jgi:hypothetical protein
VADPHILYLIVGADILGLVAWVVFVLLRAPLREPYVPVAPPAEGPPPQAKAE